MVGRRGWELAVAGSSLVSLIACSSGNAGGPAAAPDGAPGSLDDSGMTIVGADGGVPDATETASQTLGTAGGTLSSQGATLTVPHGALASPTVITITASGAAIPAGYTGLSPVFSFGPADTTFLVPVTIELALAAAPPPGATVYWSNASGGYDPLPTTAMADGVSALVDHLGGGFCGLKNAGAQDAAAGGPTDSGEPDEGIADSESTDSGQTLSGPDSGQADSGPVDSGLADSNPTDSGSGPSDSGPIDAGSVDSGPTDSGGNPPSDAGASEAAVADASTAGITVTIDGAPITFTASLTALPEQAWWLLSANDTSAATHWTIHVLVPETAGNLNCQGGIYPEITYTHYTGVAGDAGVADMTYTTQSTGATCTIDETTTATVQGQHATGTFSGTLVLSGDAGSPPSHTLTAGSYDVVVP
jgi:hypothetical protein